MDIKKILKEHEKWLKDENKGMKADLQGAYLRHADLQGADLRGANLRHADLQGADLRHTDLRHADLRDAYLLGVDLEGATLQYADLQGADLRGADLRGSDLDFSVFPLWCGSFNIKDDGKLVKQLLSHIARINCSDKELQTVSYTHLTLPTNREV